MYTNDYMYAVDRSDEYLAHYGIKGMRWGVRKAIERGGKGLGNKRLARQYRKAQKKLAKLEARANNGAKYARRAAALGAGAAAAGGLAVAGTQGVGNLMRNASPVVGKATKGVGNAIRTAGSIMSKSKIPGIRQTGIKALAYGEKVKRANKDAEGSVRLAGDAVETWGKGNSIGQAVNKHVGNAAGNVAKHIPGQSYMGTRGKLMNVSNNTYARIGAGALGAGLAGAAGYNAYRAATTKRAAKKAAQFRQEMNKTFAGTAYGQKSGGKKRRRR